MRFLWVRVLYKCRSLKFYCNNLYAQPVENHHWNLMSVVNYK